MDFVGDYKKVGLIRQAGATWVEQSEYWLFEKCTYFDGIIVKIERYVMPSSFLMLLTVTYRVARHREQGKG